MNFRAKMQLAEITSYEYPGVSVKFRCVYNGTPEDNSFSKATPSGECTLYISNPDLIPHLKLGQVYYLDFSEA